MTSVSLTKSDNPESEATAVASLAPGVFAAVTGGDLVLLDVGADLYHCLADVGGVASVDGRRLRGPPALLETLSEAGLTTEDPVPDVRMALPGPPQRRLGSSVPSRFDLVEARAFLTAARRAHGALDSLTLSEVLGLPGAPSGGVSDELKIDQTTGLFAKWLPWVPSQGACLYRAAFLRTLLRLRGQDAVWVFGVRTWPFAAHCWLQVGDAVLDDDVDRVRRYTPIMAV